MLSLIALLICAGLASISGEPQYSGYPYPAGYPVNFRNNVDNSPDGRFFLATRTVVISTFTTTSTSTSTTICTYSTAALSACVASGRRRRGVAGRGLLYEENQEGSIFLPSPEKLEKVAVEAESSVRSSRDVSVVEVPFVVQPGFSAPDGIAPRFLLAFSTTTVTRITTTTSTSSLVAICSSTSNYQLCVSNGK